MVERLQKYMANCGIASRRKSEEIILSGRVKVNEVVIKELGYKIDRDADKISLDGRIIEPEEKKIYIALNKPIGYLSTVKDERGRQTLLDLVKVKERIYPIGRLDYDTSGLILLTNDGDVYNKVIHPRQAVNKTYIAKIEGNPNVGDIERFQSGLDIGGSITSNAEFKILSTDNISTTVEIIIHEGKNRQIRRMCDSINHPVIDLKRVAVGNIKLDNLEIKQWRYLSDEEVCYLKSL